METNDIKQTEQQIFTLGVVGLIFSLVVSGVIGIIISIIGLIKANVLANEIAEANNGIDGTSEPVFLPPKAHAGRKMCIAGIAIGGATIAVVIALIIILISWLIQNPDTAKTLFEVMPSALPELFE